MAPALDMITVEGWTVALPASWRVVRLTGFRSFGPLFYLTNVPLAFACNTIEAPVCSLTPDGVVVIAYHGAVFDPSRWNLPVQVVKGDGYCGGLAPDEVLFASVGQTYISACLRGPDLAASEAQFRAIFGSICVVASGRLGIRLGWDRPCGQQTVYQPVWLAHYAKR